MYLFYYFAFVAIDLLLQSILFEISFINKYTFFIALLYLLLKINIVKAKLSNSISLKNALFLTVSTSLLIIYSTPQSLIFHGLLTNGLLYPFNSDINLSTPGLVALGTWAISGLIIFRNYNIIIFLMIEMLIVSSIMMVSAYIFNQLFVISLALLSIQSYILYKKYID